VADSLLAPLIEQCSASPSLRYVAAAREEECLGIAAGAAFAAQRAVVMCQNAGILNALGCYASLLQRYGLPVVILVANRGSFCDGNSYDVEKYRMFSAVVPTLDSITREVGEIGGAFFEQAFKWAECGPRPVVVSLEAPQCR
jgi:sulfopyruvate decarboxylase TPP-binding subunit